MPSLFECWCRDESAATMVEYGMLVGVIALVAAVAAQTVGTQISAAFSAVGTYLSGASVPSGP